MTRHQWRSRRFLTVATMAATLTLGSTGVAAAARDVPLDQLRVGTTEVATGLNRPTAIAGLPDGRLLITEKSGTVRAYHPRTGLAAAPVLDLSDRINESENERGLLGIAAAPNFSRSRNLYVAYTALPDGAVTLARVNLGTGAEKVLLSQEHAEFGNHNGGHVQFGKDGYLYFGIGDGGSGGDPFQSGQNLNTLLGKIIRIDVSRSCGALPYCVPRDNPFVGEAGARPEIWAWGLRNPWKFSFDKADGSLWIADVGQGRFEEVDHIGGRVGGANFGWSCMEGPNVFDETRCDASADYTDPVFHYRSAIEGCAVIGGFVYRGEKYANLAGGTYVATDFCSATAWGVRAGGSYPSATIGTFPEAVTSFGADVKGELYVVTDEPGRLFQVSFARAA